MFNIVHILPRLEPEEASWKSKKLKVCSRFVHHEKLSRALQAVFTACQVRTEQLENVSVGKIQDEWEWLLSRQVYSYSSVSSKVSLT